MTAYIDDIIIEGTPEEIQEFLYIRKQNIEHDEFLKDLSAGTHDFGVSNINSSLTINKGGDMYYASTKSNLE